MVLCTHTKIDLGKKVFRIQAGLVWESVPLGLPHNTQATCLNSNHFLSLSFPVFPLLSATSVPSFQPMQEGQLATMCHCYIKLSFHFVFLFPFITNLMSLSTRTMVATSSPSHRLPLCTCPYASQHTSTSLPLSPLR